MRAAMLFSSKLITLVCVFDSAANPVLSNETCMNWAPVRRVSQANNRLPTVLLLQGSGAIAEKGPVTHMPGDIVDRARDYLMFTVQVLYAQFIANARCQHADLRVFGELFPALET